MSNITNWQNSRNESFLIVRVEKDAYGFIIQRAHLLYSRRCDWRVGYGVILPQSKMAKNVAKYILDLDNATEEQAMQVVDVEYAYCRCGNTVYKDYTPSECPFISAKMSFRSLACFLNLDTENYNHVFLKIEQ